MSQSFPSQSVHRQKIRILAGFNYCSSYIQYLEKFSYIRRHTLFFHKPTTNQTASWGTHLPLQKIKPPPAPDTSDWSPPRAKIFSYSLHTAHSQPTAALHTSPRPKPEARDQLQSYDLRRYIDTPVKKRGVSRGNDLFFHHVNNVQRDQAAQWEFPPHPGAACGRPVSFSLSLVFPLGPLHAPNLSRNLVAGIMSRLTMGRGDTGWE